jgi:hypothetical protein
MDAASASSAAAVAIGVKPVRVTFELLCMITPLVVTGMKRRLVGLNVSIVMAKAAHQPVN